MARLARGGIALAVFTALAIAPAAAQRKNADKLLDSLIFGDDDCVVEADRLATLVRQSAEMVSMEMSIYDNDKSPGQLQNLCTAMRDVLAYVAKRAEWERKYRNSCKDAPVRSRQEIAAEDRDVGKIRDAERRMCAKK